MICKKCGIREIVAHYMCKECYAEYQKAYRFANQTKLAASAKAYYLDNQAKMAAYKKAYCQANQAKIKAHKKTYRLANRVEIKARSKAYYLANSEKCKLHFKKRRALKCGVGHEHYLDRDIFKRDGYICQLCGNKINMKLKYPDSLSPSIDHIIPIGKGGIDAPINVQTAHLGCNLIKNAKSGGQLRLFG